MSYNKDKMFTISKQTIDWIINKDVKYICLLYFGGKKISDFELNVQIEIK